MFADVLGQFLHRSSNSLSVFIIYVFISVSLGMRLTFYSVWLVSSDKTTILCASAVYSATVLM